MEAVTREVLNVDQAAEFLGFSAYTVREKARTGEIPGRKVGREWRFSREQLLEWLRAGEAPKRHGFTIEVIEDPEGGGYVATVEGQEGASDLVGRGATEDEAVHEVMAALRTASYAKKYRLELPVDERRTPAREIGRVGSRPAPSSQ
jgi:excisionase family DNA binding protein